jgi:signal peptidase II
MSRRWKIFLIVGVVSLVADQITKLWARHSLPIGGTLSDGRTYGLPVEVIPNFWDWQLSQNPGAAFGLFSSTDDARIFLSVIGIVAVLAIVWMVKKAREDQTRLSVALGLVIGGAVGNLIDRIAIGVVTDFVVWKYHDTAWPTFNVADVTLVIGVGLLFIDMSAEARREAREAKEAKDAGDSGKKKSQQKKR